MLHPLFSTLIQRPDLLVEHVSAYGALFRQEAKQAGSSLVRRVVAWVAVGVFALVFMLLGGIAVMLGMMQNQFQWVLVVVPGVALAMTLIAYVNANTTTQQESFTEFRAQIENDLQVLTQVSE